MTRGRLAAVARAFRVALAYALPTLLLAWFAGGQMLLGRIDAALAIPFLMPGALWLAWLVRDAEPERRLRLVAAALSCLLLAQMLLHLVFGDQFGIGQLLLTLLAGALAYCVAIAAVRRLRQRRRWLRWPAMLLVVAIGFAAGQGVLWVGYEASAVRGAKPKLAILSGLPLRWAGRGDLSALLAQGPADAAALAALEAEFEVRLIDEIPERAFDEALLVAHPRALAPRDLVDLDARVRAGAPVVILADALSNWPPPYPFGDPRNPPVTSLLTPLLDHWGIELAMPAAGEEAEAAVFIGPDGRKLLLHSAGRFTRLPGGCQRYGEGRVARCGLYGDAHPVWLVGDADLLHASLWQSPLRTAPWLRRADNMAWLADALRGPRGRGGLAPIWIR